MFSLSVSHVEFFYIFSSYNSSKNRWRRLRSKLFPYIALTNIQISRLKILMRKTFKKSRSELSTRHPPPSQYVAHEKTIGPFHPSQHRTENILLSLAVFTSLQQTAALRGCFSVERWWRCEGNEAFIIFRGVLLHRRGIRHNTTTRLPGDHMLFGD